MEHEGRPWQLLCNYIQADTNNMEKEKGKRKKKKEEKKKKNHKLNVRRKMIKQKLAHDD